MGPKIFLGLLCYERLTLLLVCVIRVLTGHGGSLQEVLCFWTCADGVHYLDIARDGYFSLGSIGRLMQLVFLPGYPLAVRLMHLVIRNCLYAGLLVSALSFAGAGCVIDRLARLDADHAGALRTVKYLCLWPGAFFFAAPHEREPFSPALRPVRVWRPEGPLACRVSVRRAGSLHPLAGADAVCAIAD